MVIDELLKLGLEKLQKREYTNPTLEVRLILAKLLDVDKSYIYAYGNKEVSKDIVSTFLELIEKRAEGYPIQYLLGEKEFMGLDLYIEEGVLVPRSDTEILVEFIIDYINKNYKDIRIDVLDLCSGSGAISLSIAKYCPNTSVYGIDIGNIPIKVANINKERLGLTNVDFIKGDIFEPLPEDKRFSIIVSNPPYIPKEEIRSLQPEVGFFEPKLALDGGDDGLDFYRKISKEAKLYLNKKGLLAYEIGYNQANEVRDILIKEGYINIEIIKDLQGLDRVIVGILE